jgi:hypothetical protein
MLNVMYGRKCTEGGVREEVYGRRCTGGGLRWEMGKRVLRFMQVPSGVD